MQKIYLLLRNNKQSGPYALNELLQLSIKPFDLIWREGKTAAWQYPSELEELKPYLEETKQNTAAVLPKSTEKELSALTNQPEIEKDLPKKPKTFAAKQKVYISLPACAIINSKNSTERIETSETTAEISVDDREKLFAERAERMRQKAAINTTEKVEQKNKEVLDTKYSRSLEDIKEEYASWLYKRKNGKQFLSKKHLAVPALLLISAITLYSAKKILSSSPQEAQEQLAIIPDINEQKETNDSEEKVLTVADNIGSGIKNKELEIIKENVQSNTNSVEVDDHSRYPEKEENSKTKTKYSNNPKVIILQEKEGIDKTAKDESNTIPEKKKSVSKQPYPVESPTSDSKEAQIKVDNPATNQSNSSAKKPVSTRNLAQLVEITEKYGYNNRKKTISDLQLYVNNQSNETLTTVAVDVYYFSSDNTILEKKTFYLNNIAPKTSGVVAVPDKKKASSVKYQLGLISSENGLFYARQ